MSERKRILGGLLGKSGPNVSSALKRPPSYAVPVGPVRVTSQLNRSSSLGPTKMPSGGLLTSSAGRERESERGGERETGASRRTRERARRGGRAGTPRQQTARRCGARRAEHAAAPPRRGRAAGAVRPPAGACARARHAAWAAAARRARQAAQLTTKEPRRGRAAAERGLSRRARERAAGEERPARARARRRRPLAYQLLLDQLRRVRRVRHCRRAGWRRLDAARSGRRGERWAGRAIMANVSQRSLPELPLRPRTHVWST